MEVVNAEWNPIVFSLVENIRGKIGSKSNSDFKSAKQNAKS